MSRQNYDTEDTLEIIVCFGNQIQVWHVLKLIKQQGIIR